MAYSKPVGSIKKDEDMALRPQLITQTDEIQNNYASSMPVNTAGVVDNLGETKLGDVAIGHISQTIEAPQLEPQAQNVSSPGKDPVFTQTTNGPNRRKMDAPTRAHLLKEYRKIARQIQKLNIELIKLKRDFERRFGPFLAQQRKVDGA